MHIEMAMEIAAIEALKGVAAQPETHKIRRDCSYTEAYGTGEALRFAQWLEANGRIWRIFTQPDSNEFYVWTKDDDYRDWRSACHQSRQLAETEEHFFNVDADPDYLNESLVTVFKKLTRTYRTR